MKDFHIGHLLKIETKPKNISPKEIAEVISHYRQHADKIFKLKDMDVANVVKISYRIRTNLLEILCRQFKSLLPDADFSKQEDCFNFVLDMKTNRIVPENNAEGCDFLEQIDIGKHIKAFADKNNRTQQEVAKMLGCSQSTISELYKSKSIKVKSLFQISIALEHHFVAEVYLSKIRIEVPRNDFDGCIFSVNEKEITIKNRADSSFSMTYQRQNDDENAVNRINTDKEPKKNR